VLLDDGKAGSSINFGHGAVDATDRGKRRRTRGDRLQKFIESFGVALYVDHQPARIIADEPIQLPGGSQAMDVGTKSNSLHNAFYRDNPTLDDADTPFLPPVISARCSESIIEPEARQSSPRPQLVFED